MKKHWILNNLIAAVVLVTALLLGVHLLLGVYTQHNKTIEVPDFANMQVSEASKLAKSSGLSITVADSVFVPRMDRGAVFSQLPKAGAAVKNGRNIHVTINATTPKKITMPNVVGLSLRQAKSELTSRGLFLGRLMYVSDMATNNVLKQLYHGSEIAAGSSVVSGTSIDLMIGLNESDFQTRVPDVCGMKYTRAMDVIKDYYLNVGRVRFDQSVQTYSDSLNAVVYAQNPGGSELEECRMGEEVTISLSVDPDKVSRFQSK